MRARTKAMLVAAAAAAIIAANASVALAADVNRDRIPDSWEKTYRLSLRVNQAKGDIDSDGLTNYAEWRSHTNPRVKDSDHDGKSDANEDYDRDGLSNLGEVRSKTDIRVADTDHDGTSDAREDGDHDGLRNSDEMKCHTNPLKADSDGDGESDDREDADHDGLSNKHEITLKTNPRSSDSDHDGVSDDREDADHDGLDNEDEYVMGTNPLKGDSDGDGREDGDQRGGVVVSYDQTSGVVAIRLLTSFEGTSTEMTVTAKVTSETEFEWAGDHEGDSRPTAANLVTGAIVREFETEVGDGGVLYAHKVELRSSATAVFRGGDYEYEDD